MTRTSSQSFNTKMRTIGVESCETLFSRISQVISSNSTAQIRAGFRWSSLELVRKKIARSLGVRSKHGEWILIHSGLSSMTERLHAYGGVMPEAIRGRT